MLRPRIALIALAAVALSACATFDNTDVVASVGDAELGFDELARRARSIDDFQRLLQQQSPDDTVPAAIDNDRVSGDLARRTIQSWIDIQLLTRADVVDAWVRGPTESGLGCIFYAPAPDVVTSDSWIEQLEAGEDWDTIVEQSPIPVEANGRIPCFPTAGLDPLIVDQLTGMSAEDPYRTLTLPDQTAGLARMQSLEELDGTELRELANFVEPSSIQAISAEIDDTDIEVSPRYGVFDPDTITVQPIG